MGDTFCEFRVGRVKERDYITLESVACRGLFVGMTPEGRVTPTVDTGGGRNIRFYPEIVECKLRIWISFLVKLRYINLLLQLHQILHSFRIFI